MSNTTRTLKAMACGFALTSRELSAMTGLPPTQMRKAIYNLLDTQKVTRVGRDYPPTYQINPDAPDGVPLQNEGIVQRAIRTQSVSVFQLQTH